MKSLVVVLLIGFSLLAPLSVFAQGGTKHIRYYRCSADLVQRFNLLTGESLKAVLDKDDCKLFYKAPVAEALESGIKSIQRGAITNGYGIWSGPEGGEQALFVFNEEQIHSVVENLSYAQASDLNVSLYFMVYQSNYRRRGYPDTIYMHVLNDAPILLETSKD